MAWHLFLVHVWAILQSALFLSFIIIAVNISLLITNFMYVTANANNENKTDQFLGSSMASNGERFMVKA